jgi:cytoskeletal protein RodZ
MAAAWAIATFVAMFLVYEAVDLVQSNVTDAPIDVSALEDLGTQPDVDASSTTAPSTPSSAPTTTVTATTPIVATDTTTPNPPTPTTTAGTAPTTTAPSTSTSTTSTTVATPDSHAWYFTSIGGHVSGFCTGDAVSLNGAVPSSSAFHVDDIEYSGPKKVEVTFESDDHTSEVSVKCKGGTAIPDIEEEPEED